MSDFRDLMHAQMDSAAAGFAAEDFAGGYGRGVVGRVRRRRTVRAVGVGGVSAVAVGALAVGTAQFFGGAEQPAGGASVRCVSVEDDLGSAMWQGDFPPVLLSSFGDGVSVSLTTDALTVSLPGITDPRQVIEVRDHQLVGPDGVTDGPVVVTFASGKQAVVDLDWTNDRVQVAFGPGTEPTSTVSGAPPTGAGELLLPGEAEGHYHGLDLSGGNDVRWLLYDDVRQQVQAMIEIDGDLATVTFRDGATQSFPTGDDRIATFTWAGVTTVSLDPQASSDALLWGPAVKAPVDQTITGSLLCNVLATGPVTSAGPSPMPSESTTAMPTQTVVDRVITALPYETADDVWLTSGGERVALFFWRQSSDGLMTMRASESGDVLPNLAEYTVAVVDGVARVPVGNAVVRVRVGSGGAVTVESVEPAGAQASVGKPTSVAVDPWFSLGFAHTIDLDAVTGG